MRRVRLALAVVARKRNRSVLGYMLAVLLTPMRQGRGRVAHEAHRQQVFHRHPLRWLPHGCSHQQSQGVRLGQKQVRQPRLSSLPAVSRARIPPHLLHHACRYGQLGIDSVDNSYVPTLISRLQLLNVSVIAAGYHHSICITGDGDACVAVRAYDSVLGWPVARARWRMYRVWDIILACV